jgi:hypothetical protein
LLLGRQIFKRSAYHDFHTKFSPWRLAKKNKKRKIRSIAKSLFSYQSLQQKNAFAGNSHFRLLFAAFAFFEFLFDFIGLFLA